MWCNVVVVVAAVVVLVVARCFVQHSVVCNVIVLVEGSLEVTLLTILTNATA